MATSSGVCGGPAVRAVCALVKVKLDKGKPRMRSRDAERMLADWPPGARGAFVTWPPRAP